MPRWSMEKLTQIMVEDPEMTWRSITTTPHKGTIKAYFSNITFQGNRPTKPIQGKEQNGGGSSFASSDLKTTMKSKKSGKKQGISLLKGAKSRRKTGKLTRELQPDSSQMGIRNYFSKKLGTIETGLAKKIRSIPMGDTDFSIKTRS